MELKRTTTHYFFFLLLLSAHNYHYSFFVEGFNGVVEEEIKRSDFPPGFFFGAGTSSYQIEGAFLDDGKGLSNWDVFLHNQTLDSGIRNGDNGDVADDHYHRYMEDIEILHSLGVNAYRFSVSWARVLPRGRYGEINPAGILFYNKIIDNLLLKGIEPFVTIHHHDFPQELEDRYGSWLSPLMQDDFLHFAKTCFKSFGNRVKYWTTINEPNMFAQLAYELGVYPPAHCSAPFGNCSAGNSDVEPLIVMHNMLLAHGKATKLYRKHFQPKQGGFIGINAVATMYEPLTGDELDQEAALRALAFNIAWTLDPLIFGDYPPEMHRYHGSELPRFSPEEKKYMKDSIDFIGISHYSTCYAKDCTHSICTSSGNRAINGFVYATGEKDGVSIGEQMALPMMYVVPRGMREIVNYLKERYHNKPLYVAENGYSPKQPEVQDVLQDVKRVEFYKANLAYLVEAMKSGADVRGYFIWSLMDGFEWVTGYHAGFGMYYVDRQTLERTPKLSATWYRNFLTNSSVNCNEEGPDRRSFTKENAVLKSELVGEEADQQNAIFPM